MGRAADCEVVRTRLIAFISCVCLAVSANAAAPSPAPHPLPTAAPAGDGKLNVLILGDSLALCGFGKRLDSRFRAAPHVNATFTYMACGTNPISWMKRPPYTNVRTQCGYWSIESSGDGAEPRELRDSYGMGQKGPLKP